LAGWSVSTLAGIGGYQHDQPRFEARAKSFYDAALKPLGYSCLSAGDTSLGYGKDAVALWISLTRSPVKADPASGLHFLL
jgi:hypothetical protein